MSYNDVGGEVVVDLTPYRSAFMAIHIIGEVGLTLFVLTLLLWKGIQRHSTLINFCITWIIYSTVYCLFLYGGADSDPHSPLCIAQAALIFGAPPMTATAGLVLIMHVWLTFQTTWRPSLDMIPRTLRYFLMFAPPYISFTAFSIASGVLGMKHPEAISAANGLYCTLYLDPFQRYAVPLFVLGTMVMTFGFEFAIAFQFLRQWAYINKTFPLKDRNTNISLVLRIAVFSICSWAALSAAALFLTQTSSALRHMIPAALPLVALIVFGTTRDLWRFSCFRSLSEGSIAPTDSIPTARPYNASLDDPFD